jgi:hypothetical protein
MSKNSINNDDMSNEDNDKIFVVDELNIPNNKHKILDKLQEFQLYPWQKKIEDKIQYIANSWRINWIYDAKGSMGKSTLCKYLLLKYPGTILKLNGSHHEMKIKVGLFDMEHKDKLRCCLINFNMSYNNYVVPYEAIEEIKNGTFYCSINPRGIVSYPCPHIFCFADFKPDKTRITKDRWKVIDITPKYYDPKKEYDRLENIRIQKLIDQQNKIREAESKHNLLMDICEKLRNFHYNLNNNINILKDITEDVNLNSLYNSNGVNYSFLIKYGFCYKNGKEKKFTYRDYLKIIIIEKDQLYSFIEASNFSDIPIIRSLKKDINELFDKIFSIFGFPVELFPTLKKSYD